MTDPAFSRPESRPSSNPLTTDITASPTNDAASSLRAAALLTLKAKRRKPTMEASAASMPASRPIPTADSVLLDYGQEDSSSQPPIPPTPALTSDSALASSNPARAPILPSITDDEDGQIREEGEISEEEETPVVAPQLSSSPHVQDLDTRMGSPPSAFVNTDARYLKSSPPRRSSPLAGPSSPIPALVNRISDPQSYTSFYDDDEADLSHEVEMEDTSRPNQPFFFLDADHVRPGLPLSQLEYDTAKDLVLDLLGWGVPPEYLVDCGLTREMVYYVFSELNLRLPQNLNITGLIPYTPELLMMITSQQLSVTPTPTPTRQEVPSLLQRLQLGSHLPIPPQREETPPRASGNDFPGSVQTSPTGDLHDMERQRRQELLARKAVQASRKTKQTPASTDSTPTSAIPRQPSEPPRSTDNQNFETTSPVPTELVEDFLKTIGSIQSQSSSAQSKVSTPEPPHQFNIDAMDVDEIPGLGMARHSASVSRTSSLPDVDHDSLAHRPIYADHIVISPSTLSHPPTSSASSAFAHTSTSTTKMSIDYSSNPGTDHQESSSTFGIQQRRRPVASDFVDFDSMPRSATTTNNGYSSSYARYARKDAGANFSNVAMKRCVIDLSDSEGEDDEHHTRDAKRAKSRGYASPAPSVPNPGSTSGWATPPMQGSMTPAVLAEKELEIQRMKEMILQKEKQQRLAKERAMKRSEASTPTATFDSHPSAPVPIITVKQEEDESRTVTSLSSHPNGFPVAFHQLNGNQADDGQSKSATPGEYNLYSPLISGNVHVVLSPSP
ncbi:hypothetical protein BDQ12DRAFT_470150 [Crucibulum laeve]|uniref:Uncharacterized protein n=1 Tax=Crucibulum laeve TaxID=68775 RepID=A0A5C3M7N5_9AGAR|nr:hypothetical protein BDQ12DRAFT_470150 [Crucibulum laeve]